VDRSRGRCHRDVRRRCGRTSHTGCCESWLPFAVDVVTVIDRFPVPIVTRHGPTSPTLVTHHEMTDDERPRCRLPRGYVRIMSISLFEPATHPAFDEVAHDSVLAWLDGFVLLPHPELRRDGPVCPFVGPAMRQHTLVFR